VGGSADLVRLSNADVELDVAAGYGPRIVRYARRGGPSVLGTIAPAALEKATPFGEPWRLYGGHRLWHAPEHATRTYWPDNAPVGVRRVGDATRFEQEVEGNTHLRKSIDVTLAEAGTDVTVVHRIANEGAFDVELALWALTVMAPGGRALVPHAPFVPFPADLGPARRLVLWSYTRLDDPRFRFGARLLVVAQDATRAAPQKIGAHVEPGRAAYVLGRALFLKRWAASGGPHSDLGCNLEIFVDGAMLELETLSPLVRIPPGAHAAHVERWSLHDVEDGLDDDGLADALERACREAAP
jgi:hypothetical protein